MTATADGEGTVTTPALWPTAHQAFLAGQSPAIPGTERSVEHDQIEQAFIDAVMDTVVSHEVGALNLRVRDVVTIAKWLAPVHAALVGPPAPEGGA